MRKSDSGVDGGSQARGLRDISGERLPKAGSARFSFWCRAYLAIAGAIAIGYAVLFAWRRSAWPLGDWLINYQGGFVRRGLMGQFVLVAAHVLHVPVAIGASGLICVCVIVGYACLWWLVGRVATIYSPIWLRALFFSPATLAFVWLDPFFALRKELALFALLGLTIVLLQREVSDVRLGAFLAAGCGVVLLSHEAMACYLPYLFAAVALGRRSWRKGIQICSAAIAISCMAIAAAALHPGNSLIAERVCESIGGEPSGLCYGPIWYLGLPRAAHAEAVAALAQDRLMIVVFAMTAVMAMVPAIGGLRDMWRRPVSRNTRYVLPAMTVVALAASTVLFWQALDWSRWIYIHAMCLLFLLLFAISIRRDEETDAEQAAERARKPWAVIAVVLYAICWNMPGLGQHWALGYGNVFYRAGRHVSGARHAGR